MSHGAWRWTRLVGGAAILVVLGWRVGTGPFLDGVQRIDAFSLLAVFAITAVTTVCSAWRWSIIADGLGVGLPLRTAIAAYYRSQFLNSALPGGVLGDVHRGVRHGREARDLGRGLRAVAWERTVGQIVQAAVAVVVLVAFASPVRSSMPIVVAAGLTGAGVIALVVRGLPHVGASRTARIARAVDADVRHGLLDRRAWPAITVASIVVVAGHAGVFLIAARTVGVTATPQRLLPLAIIALLAMSVPLSIGGWGPREGVTAWAFGAAGLGVDQGVATATAYGVMAFVATLPGALVLIIGRVRRVRVPLTSESPEQPHPVIFAGASHG